MPEPGSCRRPVSETFNAMMDQQTSRLRRPVSADPCACDEALGQLPKAPPAKPDIATKTTVEIDGPGTRAQARRRNQLTIRRVERGKSYSFVRANGTAIRHAGTIRRLNSMAVPPAYADVRYAGRILHASAGGRPRCRRPAAVAIIGLGKGPRQRKAHRLARLVAALPAISAMLCMLTRLRIAASPVRPYGGLYGVSNPTGAVYAQRLDSGWSALEHAPSQETEKDSLHQQIVTPEETMLAGESWQLSAKLIAGSLQLMSDTYSLQFQGTAGAAEAWLIDGHAVSCDG